MPYINPRNREQFENVLKLIDEIEIDTVGELNYFITSICSIYERYHGESYGTHNSIVGVLECLKLEWYRRRTAKYEDQKIIDNGDVK